MLNKLIVLVIVLSTYSIHSFAQEASLNQQNIALRKKNSLLNLEKMITKSFKKTSGNEKITTQKDVKENNLKEVRNKLDIKDFYKSSQHKKNKSLALTTVISQTNGRKKMIKHKPIKTRIISKKTSLALEKILNSKN